VSFDAWATLVVVAATVFLLATERLPSAPTVVGAVVVLLLAGVIDPAQAFQGFSNEAVITVGVLYVLAGAAEVTGAMRQVTSAALGRGGHARAELARVMLPSAVASAFINNTPLVAMTAPPVAGWARRIGRAPSRYLMPLNYAIVLAGLVTAIGTSTNIVISGLLRAAHRRPLDLFEITPVGLPVALAGIAVLWLATTWLLPERRDPRAALGEEARSFTVEMIVAPGGPQAGRTVAEAGLRELQGVFLVELERDGRRIAPVSPDEVLVERDRLTFAGNVAQILDLQRIRGLVSAEHPHFGAAGAGHNFFEAVVGPNSPLVGQTLREVGFRARYGAAVVAIHRAGERVPAKLGRVQLHSGDVLLLLADPGFRARWVDRHDFLVISPLSDVALPRTNKAPIVGLVTIGIVVLAGTGLLPLIKAALAGVFALVVLGAITPAQARRSIDLDVMVMIAASFGLGAAMDRSGLAAQVAHVLVRALATFGDLGALAGILLATVFVTQLITNNAAAVLMFPIGLATAAQTGINERAIVMAVAVGASASFLTPIGYQTNLMVYGMGGYRFWDFTRLGWPIVITTVALTLTAIPVFWPLR
jgi:di/tricarboxylate transporter